MDFESTLSTVAQQLPEELDDVITAAVSYIPEDLANVIRHASGYLPAQLDIVAIAKFMLYFAAASIVLGLLGRLILGKRSGLNCSLSSAMGILAIYALTVIVYTFKPWNLEFLLSPLPFVTFSGEYLIVLPLHDTAFPALCTEVLSLVILSFLFHLIDSIIPRGESLPGWYILRFLTVILAMVVHLGVSWAFRTYLPAVLVTYAPAILLVLLAVMLFAGILGLVLGFVIAVANPFLGAMCTFFFSSVVGKHLSKAVFSSAILCAVVYLMGYFGYTVIPITAAALMTYIPLVLVLLLLWYIIGHVL